MSELEKLRDRIDEIDSKVVAYLNERVEVAKQVGEYKREKGLDIKDEGREEGVLEKVKSKTVHKEFMEELYKKIIGYCRENE